MRRRLTALALLVGVALAQEKTRGKAPVRETVLPTNAERAWRSIAWRPTLWEAVVEAHRAKRPILLWAMNGHPLGLT